MSWGSQLRSLKRRWLRRAEVEEDLDHELQSYFEMRAERGEARSYESIEQVKQKVREARLGAMVEELLRDTRYAWRTLRKSPSFLVVAVLTLALGIGANTAIFSLINAVMLRLLPVAHPEQLVSLTDPDVTGIEADTQESGVRRLFSFREFEELRKRKTGFSGMFAAQSELSDLDVYTGKQVRKAHAQLVSGDFFGVLGLKPLMGRVFTPQEDRTPGANPVGVISYGFWQREFAGSAAAVGRTIRVGQTMFQIVGVAPVGFRGVLVGEDTDVWFPLTMQKQVIVGRDYLEPVDMLWLAVMGRLTPGITRQRAEAEINVRLQQTLRRWAAALPTAKARQQILNQKIELRTGGKGASGLRWQYTEPLLLLMGMVGLVLLIACANLANLMLARAAGRQREISIRLALGVGRARLVRQLLTESLLIAAAGGVLGTLLAVTGTRLLLAMVAGGVHDLALDAGFDGRVLAFTAAISLLTGVMFGLAPALRATRVDANQTLSANVRGTMGARGGMRSGRILVIAQVAMSLLLLMGAALFVQSLRNMMKEKPGLQRDRLLMAHIDPVTAGYGYRGAKATALYRQLGEKLGAIPGVRSVTLSKTSLFSDSDSGDQISLDVATPKSLGRLGSNWTLAGPNYFATLGIPLLRGRDLTEADAAHGAPVCVINAEFARTFFPNADPIGKHVTDEYPTTRETYEIVGVAADAKEHELNEKAAPRFYANIFHPIGGVGSLTVVLRTAAAPSAAITAVRHAIRAIDPNLPVLSVRTVDEQINRQLTSERLVAELAVVFGGVALLMAMVGLSGVMSYATSRRTSEIGVRMALGASSEGVAWMVLRETFAMVTIGIVIGFPVALAAGRLVSNRLFGLTSVDPLTIGWTVLILLTTAGVAGWVPARRASAIDPMTALRSE